MSSDMSSDISIFSFFFILLQLFHNPLEKLVERETQNWRFHQTDISARLYSVFLWISPVSYRYSEIIPEEGKFWRGFFWLVGRYLLARTDSETTFCQLHLQFLLPEMWVEINVSRLVKSDCVGRVIIIYNQEIGLTTPLPTVMGDSDKVARPAALLSAFKKHE